MNLPNKALQTAYYQALNGNISFGGSNVPIYDVVPDGDNYPYILLGSQNVIEDVSKDDFGTEIVMDIDVVTGFEGSFGGKSMAYDISDDVVNAIRTRTANYLSLSGFTMITTTLDSSLILQEDYENYVLYINKLRFRHKIQQD
tara:strand:- start:182 stop:610 length:429 start_codon:yes stop_codon:yes gene_type:complete